MQEKITALEKQLSDINAVNSKINILSSTQPVHEQLNRPYRSNKNRSPFTPNRQSNLNYQSKCFGCNQSGHLFQRCRLLSQPQKDQLRDELRDFYKAANESYPNVSANIADFEPSFSLNSNGTVASHQPPYRHQI